MNRIDYQIQQAHGGLLNIGCGDDPAGFHRYPGAVSFDMDTWDFPNFVQGDCAHLPFADNSFDTAVLGDVLEHCLDPDQAVREAARVARRVVMTIPEELLLPSVGQHIEEGIRARADHYRAYYGLTGTHDEVIAAQKAMAPNFVHSVPESVQAHDGHINRFDDAWVQRLIQASGKSVIDFDKVSDGSGWLGWWITLE